MGVQPGQAPPPAPAAARAKGPSTAQQAFQRGLTTLPPVGRRGPTGTRKAAETLPDRSETKLGIWYSNTKSRRDKLTAEQLDALRKLGVEWAV